MLKPQQEVGGADETHRTSASRHGTPCPQREAGTSGHSQKSSGSSNQQQLHPEQETADRGETSSEFLPISAPFYAFSLLHPFFFVLPQCRKRAHCIGSSGLYLTYLRVWVCGSAGDTGGAAKRILLYTAQL